MITNADNIPVIDITKLYADDLTKLKSVIGAYIISYLKRPDLDALKFVDHMLDYILENGPPEYCIADVTEDATKDSMNRILCTDCAAECCDRCDLVSIDDADLMRISKHLNMPYKKVIKKHMGYVPQEQIDMIKERFDADLPIMKLKRVHPCEFLNEDRCEIYPVRPRACRVYPLIQRADQGYGFELHPICRYPLNVFITEIVGRCPPELWKKPELWMYFVDARSRYRFIDEGITEAKDQKERINAYKKGNDWLWKFVRSEHEG